ncbi:hypothetical protein MUO83_07625 [Candidatus Bathyarchaeota archaeon]|nr:hypothetical protein [Candidatus Bathyarchaeota archaeon]
MSEESEVKKRALKLIERCEEIRSLELSHQHPTEEYAIGDNVLQDPLEISAERCDGYSPLELVLIKKGLSQLLVQEQ